MKTIEGDLLLNDFTSEASRFFVSYRTPVALIAAASLQGLLLLTRIHHKADRKKKKNRLEEWTVTLCHLNFLFSFVLSMAALVLSTTAEVNIYRRDFKPLAENTFEFLNKQFKFEFAAVRWCFLMSLFALLRGLACHLLLEYNLLRREKMTEGTIVVLAFVSVITGLVSYVNTAGTLNPWNNILLMTKDLAKMSWIDSLSFRKPLLVLSLLSSGLCFGLTAYYCLHHGKEEVGASTKIDDTGTHDKTQKKHEVDKKKDVLKHDNDVGAKEEVEAHTKDQ